MGVPAELLIDVMFAAMPRGVARTIGALIGLVLLGGILLVMWRGLP